MWYEKVSRYLEEISQIHLKEDLSTCSENDIRSFYLQLQSYSPDLIQRQRLTVKRKPSSFDVDPISDFKVAGSRDRKQTGKNLFSIGRVATVVLAGGQASRLGIDFPKALFPVTPVRNKSLIELVFEKLKCASAWANSPLSLAILTSPLNHNAIQEFLSHQNLESSHVDLFCQKALPLLDEQGNWFLTKPGSLAIGPDGNGGVFHLLFSSGIMEQWKQMGVEYIQFTLIDNPLADPFDAELIGFCHETNADVAIKAIYREPNEKVGLLLQKNKKVGIVEYTEISEKIPSATTPDGKLQYPLANISLFCIRLSFLEKLDDQKLLSLPWHIARKKAQKYHEGKTEQKEALKFESFWFDILAHSQNTSILVYPREEVYAPLKNAEGKNSLPEVQEALIQSDRRVFKQISGIQAPLKKIEIDPAFYYPTPELLKRWKGKPFPDTDYLNPF